MSWQSSEQTLREIKSGLGRREGNGLVYGITLLDYATRGIYPDDLILIGAPTGAGKTQFCTNLALANVRNGKRVHMMALEAYKGEIEDRMLFSMCTERFYASPARASVGFPLSYSDWRTGKLNGYLAHHIVESEKEFDKFRGLKILYKPSKFTHEEMVSSIYSIAAETDLVIVDHVHYFDYDEQNENSALKEIAKAARQVSQIIRKPIVLVGHLRKRDRFNKDLVPGIEEFHGSSDLTKIATVVVTLGKGQRLTETKSDTYLRVCKSRIDGGLQNYIIKMIYDSKINNYEKIFTLGILSKDRTDFELLQGDDLPFWAKAALL